MSGTLSPSEEPRQVVKWIGLIPPLTRVLVLVHVAGYLLSFIPNASTLLGLPSYSPLTKV